MFAGQALSGVLVDTVLQGRFEPRKPAGVPGLVAGLAANALVVDRRCRLN